MFVFTVGVPDFKEEVQKITSQVHVQTNFAQKTQTLRFAFYPWIIICFHMY